jgi:1-acyl-sn-glycerol-3-phosphate acyltransferase
VAKSLVLDKRFLPLFFTQFLGALNDNIFKNALVILITYKSVSLWGFQSADLVALAGALFILPYFLFSATAGQICDFYQKRSVILATKCSELLIVTLGLIGLWTANFSLMMFVLFLLGVQSTIFGPLKYGSLPDLVGRDAIVEANAFVSGATFIAILIGTLLGGSLVAIDGYLWGLSIALVLVSLVGLYSAQRVPKLPLHSGPETKVNWTFFLPTWEVLKITWSDTKIFKSLLSISWFWFLGAAILSILPILVKEVYLAGEGVATLFLTTFTVGMGLGAYIAQRLGRDRPEMGMPPLALVFMSLFLILLSQPPEELLTKSSGLINVSDFLSRAEGILSTLYLLILATFGGCYIVPLMSYIQIRSKPSELARVIAGNNIWNALFMVSASVLLIYFYSLNFGVQDVLWFLAIANIFVSIIQYSQDTQKPIRFLAYMLVKVFYRLEVNGRENLPAKGPYIIVSNHVSFIDWLFLLAVCKQPLQFVIDHNYYFLPGLPFWLRQAKLIPIATKAEKAELLESAFVKISDSLNKGAVIGLFPEGAITKTGEVRRFMPGLSKIVARDPVPVIPVALNGLWGSFFSRSGRGPLKKWPWPLRRKIKVTIGQIRSAEQLNLTELQKEVVRLRENENDYHR